MRRILGLLCLMSATAAADPAVTAPPAPGVTTPCPREEDELVEVDYPDSGGLWIPHEAACGGDFPLVILLHGENGDRERHLLVGGYLDIAKTVRDLIDAGKMRPVLLAEPVELGSMQNNLYVGKWDPVEHLAKLKPVLESRKIRAISLGYIGHSAAGCNAKGGLYEVLSRINELEPRLTLWNAADICYLGNYHWREPARVLARRGVTMINLHVAHPTGGFENGMDLGKVLPCPDGYKKCATHRRENWCSFRAKRGTEAIHRNATTLFVRDLLPRVYPLLPASLACRRR